MRIDIKNGYVILRDTISHKASKEYLKALHRHGQRVQKTSPTTGEIVDDFEVANEDVFTAAEQLALHSVVSIVQVQPDGSTIQIKPSQEWLDQLEEDDSAKLEKAMLAIYRGRNADVKKSLGEPSGISTGDAPASSPQSTTTTG